MAFTRWLHKNNKIETYLAEKKVLEKDVLKEGLEQKAARDELYADMVMETGREFKKTAALFRQGEKNIE